MDYLHGDVSEAEAQDACAYEYARESGPLRELASRRDEICQSKNLDLFQAAMTAIRNGPMHYPWARQFLLEISGFPGTDWNALPAPVRKSFWRSPRNPLPVTDIATLDALGVFESFKTMAGKARPQVEEVPPGSEQKPLPLVMPLLQLRNEHHVIIANIDFSKSETQLANEFKAWLKEPDQQNLIKRYQRSRTDPIALSLDRLKDLAAWRLYRELDNDVDRANEFANVHRKRFTAAEIRQKYKTAKERKRFRTGDLRPFRDAKEQGGVAANSAALFSADSEARKTERRAWQYLADLMPSEFGPVDDGLAQIFLKLHEYASNP